MREILHLQAGQCGNQIGSKVSNFSQIIVKTVLNYVFVKETNVVKCTTLLVLKIYFSFGKLYPMNMELTIQACIMETITCSWTE